jgi:hypothetical protein
MTQRGQIWLLKGALPVNLIRTDLRHIPIRVGSLPDYESLPQYSRVFACSRLEQRQIPQVLLKNR